MHILSEQNTFALTVSPSATHKSLGAMRFQTAWRGTRTAKRQASMCPLICSYRLVVQSLPLGTTPVISLY